MQRESQEQKVVKLREGFHGFFMWICFKMIVALPATKTEVVIMKKHITFEERVCIQEGLKKGESFAKIAEEIGKSRSAVSREVHARKLYVKAKGNCCIHRSKCDLPSACKTRSCTISGGCYSHCNKCRIDCERFEEEFCDGYERFPYICNACQKRRHCKFSHWLYDAKHAQKLYEETLSESRKGISLSEEEFRFLDEKVVRLCKRGLSIPVIYHMNKDEMPVSERTIYTYVENQLFDMDHLTLRRKVQRPYRKKSGPVLRVDKACHKQRSHEDYLSYMEQHPDKSVCQLDSVIGEKGGKVLLTIFLTNCDLQLMYLRDRNTAASVSEIFQRLRTVLGSDRFSKIFQVLLCDRGSEFTDPVKIETDLQTGEIQCKLFYCDPMNSNQKSGCERNHEFIRYVVAKGKPFDPYQQGDITKMMNHINSTPREKWNWLSPIELFTKLYGQETTTLLGLEKIEPDSILLRPELLKK